MSFTSLKTKILFITCTFFIPFTLSSQERGLMLSKHYSLIEYKAGLVNWAVIEDNRGVMYFGNNEGLLEYDGVNWRQIPISKNSHVRSLTKDDDGRIYVGANGEMGYLAPNQLGDINYISLNEFLDSLYTQVGEVWCTQNTSSLDLFL